MTLLFLACLLWPLAPERVNWGTREHVYWAEAESPAYWIEVGLDGPELYLEGFGQ